jgi:hypothetical protein
MKYLFAYFEALYRILGCMGFLYLMVTFRTQVGIVPLYVGYVSLVAALGGPIMVLIER